MEIVKMFFGSHLYGTNTPESDTDYKGVFMPTKEQILLNRVPKSINTMTKKNNSSKNTKEDVDIEYYSIQYFIKLACEGQTVALDMLHAPDNMIVNKHKIWDLIVKNRHSFYTKNLKAFIGYARKQAAKYGIKGSRLNAAKQVIDFLSDYDDDERLEDDWWRLPVGEHMLFIEDNPNGIRQYQVCGKIFQETQKAGYSRDIITKFYNDYGERARKAANNENIDWKAISHAVRAAMQVKEILQDETITFPLKEAKTVLKIKKGEMDYTTEAAPLLESLIEEVEELSKESTLPTKVDQKFWDNFLIDAIEYYIL